MIPAGRRWRRLWGLVLLLATACADPGQSTPSPTAEEAARNLLHHEVRGSGRPVLMIHGLGASSYTWRHLAPVLDDRYEVHLVDLKGFGRSAKPRDGAYTVRHQADLLRQLIVREDIRDLTVVGHSYGGGVALLLALDLTREDPGRLHSLLLISSIGYPQELPFFVEVLRTPVVGRLVATLLPKEMQVESVMRASFHDVRRISPRAVERYAGHLAEPGAVHALLATVRQIVPRNLSALIERYATLDVPSLLIWGEHDQIVPVEVGRRLADVLPRARLRIVECSGHVPQEESPIAVIALVTEFLDNVDGRRRSRAADPQRQARQCAA